jgi:hypothetical protein
MPQHVRLERAQRATAGQPNLQSRERDDPCGVTDARGPLAGRLINAACFRGRCRRSGQMATRHAFDWNPPNPRAGRGVHMIPDKIG